MNAGRLSRGYRASGAGGGGLLLSQGHRRPFVVETLPELHGLA